MSIYPVATAAALPSRPSPTHAFQRWEVVPALLVLGGLAVWADGAFSYRRPLDFGLAYRAGVAAWETGHPEALRTWMSTSFLGLVMALVSRVSSLPIAIQSMTILNVALTAALLGAVWRALRGRMSRAAWWATLAAAAVFAPLISTALFKQITLLVLALAVAGFERVRRGGVVSGGALTAISLCLKPIVVLMPLAFLARRETRKAGWWTLAWGALLTAIAQAFLAWRAGDAGTLNPLPAFANFSKRALPWICHEENFSPRGMLCRLAGGEGWSPQPALVLAGVLLLVAMAHDSLRDHDGTAWETFAFVCLLSPMMGPVAWSHYQLFLAPMLLLLVLRFTGRSAHWTFWAGLIFSYVLASLVVRPIGTVPGGLELLIRGRDDETLKDSFRVMAASQFAQHVLFLTAYGWLQATRNRELVGPRSSAG